MSKFYTAEGVEITLEVRRVLSDESRRMDNTTRYEIIGEGQYRVLAQGWWPMWNTDGTARPTTGA